jgi:hypothetical protein
MAPTRQLLRDFVVREIICKPVILTIGKREAPFLPDGDDASIDLGKVAPKALPPGS